MTKTFVVIDGHALIFRGYYAMPPLHTEEGELVNAVFGFTTILLNMLQKIHPDYLAVTFDLQGPTFRHDSYDDYKATRAETPDDLLPQIPYIRDVVRAFRIPIFEQQGFEADDMIASLSDQLKAYPEIQMRIVSSDMDLTQLIEGTRVQMLCPLTGFNDVKIYDESAVQEKYGIRPEQIIDFKALVGDVSDNIRGVPGIGKKTAATLLQRYGSLEGIYTHLDEIKGALHDKLATGKESAFECQTLVRLVRDVPLTLDLKACETHEVSLPEIRELFNRLNFKRLLVKFEEMQNKWKQAQQESLF